MHLCFWLFFTENWNDDQQSNYMKSFILFSVFNVRFEGILSASTVLLWLTKPKFRIDNRHWKLCVYRLLNQILVRTSSTSTVRNVHSDENLFLLQHITDETVSPGLTHSTFYLSLYPSRTPIAWNKECSHSRRSNSYKNEYKKSLNLFVRIAGIMMMMKNYCFCYCSFVILLYATRFGYAIHKQNVCGYDGKNFTWKELHMMATQLQKSQLGNRQGTFLSSYRNHFQDFQRNYFDVDVETTEN